MNMPTATTHEGIQVVERWDEVFDAISAEPRRQLVVSLLDVAPDEYVSLPEAAASPSVPTDYRMLRQMLLHQHLPKLAESDFVEWQPEPLSATRGRRFEEVAVVFDALHAHAEAVPDSLVEGCQRLEDERTVSGTVSRSEPQ